MRKEQVNALIEHAKSGLKSIEIQYKDALENTTIPHPLQIDIKNCMENLRSALDYIAHDIYEKVIAPQRTAARIPEIINIYFPYGKTENDFKSGVGSSLPELKTISQNLYNIIEAIQPYKAGDNFLYDFCNILNEKKHNVLTPQIKEIKQGLAMDFGGARIQMGPGSSISGTGFIGTGTGGVFLRGDKISGDSPATRISGNVKQTIIKWVSFKFSDTGVEVLPLLKKVIEQVDWLCKNIYQTI